MKTLLILTTLLTFVSCESEILEAVEQSDLTYQECLVEANDLILYVKSKGYNLQNDADYYCSSKKEMEVLRLLPAKIDSVR